jgi:hypothetical protein
MNDRRKKAIDRIRKLLSLANSSNVHESANAAAQAAKLMAQHQIDTAEIEGDKDPVGDNRDSAVEISKGKRPPSWKWHLAWVVAQDMCKPYLLHRKIRDQIHGTMVGFVGRRSDADLCAYLYRYLIRELKRLHRERRPPLGRRQQYVPGAPPPIIDRAYQRRWSKDFYVGAIAVLNDRMNLARAEVIPKHEHQPSYHAAVEPSPVTTTALARIDQIAAEVDSFAQDMGLQYVEAKDVQIRSQEGFAAGIMAGRELDLSHAQGRDSGLPQLQPGPKKP